MLLENINSPHDLKNLSLEELKILSDEIRKRIIDVVSKNGGHLASNLGVIELTLAIHRVFHAPTDNIVWDVGHQSYTHKIITGRNAVFDTLRKKEGLSGFPKISESKFDVFNTGHSSTSISAAQGIQIARETLNLPGKTVAVIGDGALTGGMAFEALNYAGHKKSNLVVILNDNEMSISANVGAVAMYLHRLRLEPAFTTPKDYLAYVLKQIPGFGTRLYNILSRIEGSFKYLLTPGMLFEELGFKYFGPVNGYDFDVLERALQRAKDRNGPVIVHVLTQKGKGYKPAECHSNKFHGVGPFEIDTGNVICSDELNKKTFTSVFGDKICEMARKNKKIVAITAAMEEGTGLTAFAKEFPNRFFDVGIAEQHAVTMAGGMSKSGLKPFVAIYSTFMQRAYDQVFHDVALMNLPVVFCLDRAGLVGEDGSTHHGVFDVSVFRTIPGIEILAPGDESEFRDMLEYASECLSPVIIRYPRGKVFEKITDQKDHSPLFKGKSEVLIDGKDVAVFALGNTIKNSFEAAKILFDEGISVKLINPRFVKPFDDNELKNVINDSMPVITVEDNVLAGGFGSMVSEKIADFGANIPVCRIGIPDNFIEHASVSELNKLVGLDTNGIVSRIKLFLSSLR